mgnify:CR=1 FL=1
MSRTRPQQIATNASHADVVAATLACKYSGRPFVSLLSIEVLHPMLLPLLLERHVRRPPAAGSARCAAPAVAAQCSRDFTIALPPRRRTVARIRTIDSPCGRGDAAPWSTSPCPQSAHRWCGPARRARSASGARGAVSTANMAGRAWRCLGLARGRRREAAPPRPFRGGGQGTRAEGPARARTTLVTQRTPCPLHAPCPCPRSGCPPGGTCARAGAR